MAKSDMADDLDIGASSTTAYLKYNAKTGLWGWHDGDGSIDLDEPVKFVIDLANIATGWVRLSEGAAPDWRMDSAPGTKARQPSDKHKRGFLVMVAGREGFRGVGEFASSAVGVCNAVRELHRQFRLEASQHPERVPLVEVVGQESFRGRFGVNHSPRFRIVSWTRRPDGLPDERPRPDGAGDPWQEEAARLDPDDD